MLTGLRSKQQETPFLLPRFQPKRFVTAKMGLSSRLQYTNYAQSGGAIALAPVLTKLPSGQAFNERQRNTIYFVVFAV